MSLLAPHSPITVRRATRADVSAVAGVLADAFYDDPVGRWFFPSARTRRTKLERFFRLVVLERVALRHDAVHTTPDVAGAAVWMPPGTTKSSAAEQMRLMPRLARACGRDTGRALRAIAAMEAVHPHEPHWYLPQLGVSPARQGQGVGSALLEPVLDACDATALPAYLEATTPRNRALYERHGFEVTDVIRLPAGGPPLWLMWREPGQSGA